MCGIVGYIGKKSHAKEFILSGLESLEYRGYDSAGIALLNARGQAECFKQTGRVQDLRQKMGSDTLISRSGIGHTRWATHGAPTAYNAHPHSNKSKTIFVVHNGIIENYLEIKQFLEANSYIFSSDTDTEVIPHLLDYHFNRLKSFEEAFRTTVSDLSGAYAIAALHSDTPNSLFVAKLSSPLAIGISDKEYFIASDATALLDKTKKVVYLDDFEVAEVSVDSLKIYNLKESVEVKKPAQLLDFEHERSKLGDFPHYMLKEIFETPQTVESASRGRIRPQQNQIKLGGLESVSEQLRYIDRIVIVACGTSYFAGMVGEYVIEEIAGIPVEVQLASEFKYRNEPFSRSTALIAISQSGETADTIAALKKVEDYGVLRLGIVNAIGSTIARITDAGVYCHAGHEQSVASTKAFLAQVTILIEIALFLNKERSKLIKPLMNELLKLPEKIEAVLRQSDEIRTVSKKYAKYKDFLYIGRGYSYPAVLEGALKLKEVSYIHAEGYSAGEMKHGPLAMIDKSFPTLAVIPMDSMHSKTLSNIEEIRARSGPIVAIATKGDKKITDLADDVIFIPKTLEQLQPLLSAVAMQLFAYHTATAKGLNVDRPRNLAKSVTVE